MIEPEAALGARPDSMGVEDSCFAAFKPYVASIVDTLASPPPLESPEWQGFVSTCMNGGPDAELRRVADIETRRASGAFFTGRSLARKLVSSLNYGSSDHPMYFDPSCGSGSLLLEVARNLPVKKTVTATVHAWGSCLSGCDKEMEFVLLAKARLLTLAVERVSPKSYALNASLEHMFPLLIHQDALSSVASYSGAECLLMNPPFCSIEAPEWADWTSGKVNAAAVHLAHAVSAAAAGTRIAAILPDVLRCGTRYARWRALIEEQCSCGVADVHGIFDTRADVDVFILRACKGSSAAGKKGRQFDWGMSEQPGTTLEAIASVHVGPVVPHRHKKAGPRLAYIHARGLPWWRYRKSIAETRRFSGTTFSSPFVVVKRTSRPGDRKRAVACIITASGEVAVENHLLILKPKDGSLETCRQMLARLRDDRTDSWLNQHIRCRHLTVSAMLQLPWWEMNHA